MSRKAPKAGKEKEKEVEVLSAVLLADSFSEDLRPITYDIPRVLVPVAGVTLLDYAIEFLVSNGIDQIFIVANAHSQAIEEHVNSTKRRSSHRAEVSVLRCQSDCVASAIREISAHDVLRRDFILLMGDVITNMTLLRKMWQTHMLKTKADKAILMTLLLQEQPKTMELYRRRLMEVSVVNNTKLATDDDDDELPQMELTVDGSAAHKGILGEDRVSAVLDPITNNLLQYVPWKGECPPLKANKSDSSSSSQTSSSSSSSESQNEHLSLLLSLMGERPTLSIRSDLIETGMAICSMRLLELFDQNFDFRDMRDCVKNVINDDLLGNKIVVDIIPESCYLRRVRTIDSVTAISRAVLERWAYPLIPTASFASGYHNLRTPSPSAYIDISAKVGHSVEMSKNYLIGPNTVIKEGSVISNSVIGEGVQLGKNCTVKNSHVWPRAVISDNTTIEGSIICNDTKIGENCVIESGSIIAPGVVISDNQTVPMGTRLTTKLEDWEDILPLKPEDSDFNIVGKDGFGKVFTFDLTEANLDQHKLCFPQAVDAKSTDTLFTRSSSSTEPIGRETDEDRFARNVIELLDRAIAGDLEFDGTCVELRSLKFSYDVTTVDTCRAILLGLLHSIENMVEKDPSLSQLKTFRKVLSSWGKILLEFDSNSVQYAVLETLIDFATGSPTFADKISSYIYAMYEGDYLSDETILKLEEEWTNQKDDLDEIEAKMLDACQELFTALNEESEEEEEEESEESD